MACGLRHPMKSCNARVISRSPANAQLSKCDTVAGERILVTGGLWPFESSATPDQAEPFPTWSKERHRVHALEHHTRGALRHAQSCLCVYSAAPVRRDRQRDWQGLHQHLDGRPPSRDRGPCCRYLRPHHLSLAAGSVVRPGAPPHNWSYPPHFLLIVAPLAWFPYLPALMLWSLFTVGAYLLIVPPPMAPRTSARTGNLHQPVLRSDRLPRRSTVDWRVRISRQTAHPCRRPVGSRVDQASPGDSRAACPRRGRRMAFNSKRRSHRCSPGSSQRTDFRLGDLACLAHNDGAVPDSSIGTIHRFIYIDATVRVHGSPPHRT